jgi:hypothetical protein
MYNVIHKTEFFYYMSIDTQLLIIHLLDREIVRANHIATLGYRDDVKTAKQDFIDYAKTLRTDKNRR